MDIAHLVFSSGDAATTRLLNAEIAIREGVSITLEEAREANALIANTMVTQRSSTAQDLVRGKKTEIDFLNGYIVDLGKKHGIPVPYNETIVAMVKMLEQGKQD